MRKTISGDESGLRLWVEVDTSLTGEVREVRFGTSYLRPGAFEPLLIDGYLMVLSSVEWERVKHIVEHVR